LATDPARETAEITAIYIKRGLDKALASQVASQLMAFDALATHARDELGISTALTAKPLQAALISAATFSAGAAMPLLVVLLVPASLLIWAVSLSALGSLGLLGALSAHAGGAALITAAVRVTFWGALAMAMTALVGSLFGVVVA